MAEIRIPMLENKFIRDTSHLFIGIGSILLKIFPSMKAAVEQSGVKDKYKMDAREYMSFVFFVSLMYFLGIGGMMTALLVSGGAKLPILGPLMGFVMAAIYGFFLFYRPQSIVNTRVKLLERNLLYALRSLLIQIRSGVPIFNAMATVAMGNYGAISEEFKTLVEKVNSGKTIVEVLEELAKRNPSMYFRRALWQIVNSMKSGSDVGKNLEDLIKMLSKEQLVEISQYKSVLNPLAMMYMMIAVIAPSLGITMLIILSFFPGMDGLANKTVYWMLLGSVCFMQFIFMGLIKSKRPNLIGG